MAKMIRITEATDVDLSTLRKATGKSKQMLVQKAVELLSRNYFLNQVNKSYAKLKKDHSAWERELTEREAWDITLQDGLEPNED